MEQILGVILRTILLLMTGALASCATAPSPQSFDARAICQQLARASASSPELVSDAYADQCMIAHGYNSQITPARNP
jgi:hypothetical protein